MHTALFNGSGIDLGIILYKLLINGEIERIRTVKLIEQQSLLVTLYRAKLVNIL